MTVSDPKRIEKIVQQLRTFLREISVMSLATVDDQAQAHACNAYFVADDDLNIFFVSDVDSAHATHIRRRPQMAVTVHAPVHRWQDIHGVQIHGNCRSVEPDQWDTVWSIFIAKFPETEELKDYARASQFYQITPTWIRWTDNRGHFGYKVELNWPPDKATKAVPQGTV